MNPLYRTSPQLVTRAVIVAAAIAIALGVAWGYQPGWSFWFALGCGFGIAEAMVRVTAAKHGSMYQTIGMLGVLLCIILSRVILSHRLGIGLADLMGVLGSARFDDPRALALFHAMALDLPNFVYMALALAIPWVRFR